MVDFSVDCTGMWIYELYTWRTIIELLAIAIWELQKKKYWELHKNASNLKKHMHFVTFFD